MMNIFITICLIRTNTLFLQKSVDFHLSQISLESIHYDRISDASSDDTIESACITIALCNKDSNWRIFKEPPISQTHMLTIWRLKHGNKLQRRKEYI